VVTGHDKEGKAIVISDGACPAVRVNPLRPGHVSTDVWKTDSSPVILHAQPADPTVGPRQIHPPKHGTIIRIAEIQPESEELRNMPPEKAREIFKAMGNEKAWSGSRHPMMHRTETLDYAIVLEGELVMLLDDEDVHLKAGDVVIQCGTNHAWSNRSDRPCRIMYVLIDARYDAELAEELEGGEGHA
jgi:mannose-6-phosphate isomerase-like protein (cupin superfamily)